MPRVRRGNKRRLKRKKILRRAKGYYLAKSKLYRIAREQVKRSLNFAYRDRRKRKRDFRRLSRSISSPSTRATTAAAAKPGPMARATSRAVVPRANSRLVPSGKVTLIAATASAMFLTRDPVELGSW